MTDTKPPLPAVVLRADHFYTGEGLAEAVHAAIAAAVAVERERIAVLVETKDTYGDPVGCWFETLAAKIRASKGTT